MENTEEPINSGEGTIEITHSENSLKKIKINRDSGIWDILKKRCDVNVTWIPDGEEKVGRAEKKYLKK